MNDFGIGCFLSLVSMGNIAVTAEQMGISKATVRNNIRSLEEELGVPLLVPGASEVILTAAGQKFAEFFQSLEGKLNESYRILGRKKDKTVRMVVSEFISCPPWLYPAISEFRTRNPDVEIQVYQAPPPDVFRLIDDGTADIALTTRYLSRDIQGANRQIVLCEMPLLLIAARDGPYSGITWDEFTARDITHFTSYAFESGVQQVWRRLEFEYLRLGLRPTSIRALDNLDCVYLAVRLGDGIAVCADSSKTRSLSDTFTLSPVPRSVTLCLTRMQTNTSPAARKLEYFFEEYHDKGLCVGGIQA